MKVIVDDVNEAPRISDSVDLDLSENAADGTVAGGASQKLGATDPEGETVSYKIIGGDSDGIFEVSADGAVKVASGGDDKLDYEKTKTYDLKIRLSDPTGKFTDEDVKVKLNDENEKPVIEKDRDSTTGLETSKLTREVTEQSEAGTKVGKVITCSDEDEDDQTSSGGCTATCSITSHKKLNNDDISETYFSISESYQIEVAEGKSAPEFDQFIDADDSELAAVMVTVRCQDEDGLTDEQDVRISLIKFNEAPIVTASEFSIFENADTGTVVGKVKASDDEVTEGVQTLTYSITSGNSKSYFKIDASSGQITVDQNAGLDYEKLKDDGEDIAEQKITVAAKDNDRKAPKTGTAEITIKILDVNERPSLVTTFEATVAEDAEVGDNVGSAIFTGKKLDPENVTCTGRITSGNDDGIFALDANSGQLTIAKGAILDYEKKKEYSIEIEIKEPDSTIKSQDYRGNAHSTNGGAECQAWTDQEPRSHSHTPEKFPGAGLEGLGRCRDPNNRGEIWCYTKTGTKVWDYCSQTADATLTATITISDSEESPTLKAPSAPLRVREDANDGESIGSPMVGEDEDKDSVLTYSFAAGGDSGGAFSIDSSTGQIKVKSSSLIDFEAKTKHTLSVVVTDDTGKTATASADVTVEDVNEGPTVEDAVASLKEDTTQNNAAGDTNVLTTLTVTDPDAGDKCKCSIIAGNPSNAFGLHETPSILFTCAMRA